MIEVDLEEEVHQEGEEEVAHLEEGEEIEVEEEDSDEHVFNIQ